MDQPRIGFGSTDRTPQCDQPLPAIELRAVAVVATGMVAVSASPAVQGVWLIGIVVTLLRRRFGHMSTRAVRTREPGGGGESDDGAMGVW